MKLRTVGGDVESLARRLFARDHPQRAWPARATIEERALYRAFARARFAERKGGEAAKSRQSA